MDDSEVGNVAAALPWPEALPWIERPLGAILGEGERLPHALLIHGRAGIGKHAFALTLARALLCETPDGARRACGKCASCRYAQAGQHPDLLRLELLAFDDDSGEYVPVDTIAIDRVRALIDALALSSHRRGAKVAVIAPAERMNLNAANALLKTLEEPPAGTYFLLVSEQPERLPPTIVSRCRKVPFALPDAAAARAWLADKRVNDPDLLLAQAAGAPLAALALAAPQRQQERAAWLHALAAPEALSVAAMGIRIDAAGRDERKARLGDALDWLLAWTADLARARAGAAPGRNPDFAPALAALAQRVAPRQLFRYHRKLLEQRALVTHPLQARLVIESLLLDYRALFRATS